MITSTSSSTSSTERPPLSLTEPPGPDGGDGGLLEVGHVARAHGIQGHVIVDLLTNRTERVAVGSVLTVSGGVLQVRTSRPLPSPGAGLRSRWIVKFAGVDDRPAADGLRGTVLHAQPIEDPEAMWVHDLVGSTVVDQDGATLGDVTDLQANPASDLLVLGSGALVPLRFVVGHSPGRVDVDVPPGLLDL